MVEIDAGVDATVDVPSWLTAEQYFHAEGYRAAVRVVSTAWHRDPRITVEQLLRDVLTAAGPCPDCYVQLGVAHDGGCVIARCAITGRLRLTCDSRRAHRFQDCGFDKWAGVLVSPSEVKV